MIGSIALLAALLATTPPRPPARPEEPELDLDLHDIGVPDFSQLRTELRSLEKLRDLDLSRLRLLAQRDQDDEDEEQKRGHGRARPREARTRQGSPRRGEASARRGAERPRRGAARTGGRAARPRARAVAQPVRRRRRGFREAPRARATGKNGAASLAVKGPVTFRLRVQSGEVEVVPSEKPQIALSVDGVPVTGDVQILQFGDRVEAEFSGRRQLRRGRLRVELPKGSNLDFASTSGDVSVQNVGGDVRVRTMSGDVKVQGARNADGGQRLGRRDGERHRSQGEAAPRLRHRDGHHGRSRRAARLPVRLGQPRVDGSVRQGLPPQRGRRSLVRIKLQPDPAKSSFELSYASHSGDLRDELKLEVKRAPKRKHAAAGGWRRSTARARA